MKWTIAWFFVTALAMLLSTTRFRAVAAGETVRPLIQNNQLHGAVCCGMLFIGACFWLIHYAGEIHTDCRIARLSYWVAPMVMLLFCIYGAKSKGGLVGFGDHHPGSRDPHPTPGPRREGGTSSLCRQLLSSLGRTQFAPTSTDWRHRSYAIRGTPLLMDALLARPLPRPFNVFVAPSIDAADKTLSTAGPMHRFCLRRVERASESLTLSTLSKVSERRFSVRLLV
jgi:hypothetical protein